MNRALLARSMVVLYAMLFVSCSPVEERREQAKDFLNEIGGTASGAINDAGNQVGDLLKTGKSMTEGVTDMINDAKRRINQVQSGVHLLMQGKELIEEGVSGEES